MGQILKLKTYHCTYGGADKVYGVAIVKGDNDFYSLITFHGPRGKTLNERKELTSPNAVGLHGKFYDICRTREKHRYDEADWQNLKFGMRDTILALGTPPGMSSAVQTTKTAPVVVAPPVHKPAPPKRAAQPRLGRSLEQRDF